MLGLYWLLCWACTGYYSGPILAVCWAYTGCMLGLYWLYAGPVLADLYGACTGLSYVRPVLADHIQGLYWPSS